MQNITVDQPGMQEIICKKGKKLEEIIDRVWFHLDRRLLKEPVILEKIRLDDE